MYKGEVVVITRGIGKVGRVIAEALPKNRTAVCVIDKRPNDYDTEKIVNAEVLRHFAEMVTHSHDRAGNPIDIANMALFLCAEKARLVAGENNCGDDSVIKQMIYAGNCGWAFHSSEGV